MSEHVEMLPMHDGWSMSVCTKIIFVPHEWRWSTSALRTAVAHPAHTGVSQNTVPDRYRYEGRALRVPAARACGCGLCLCGLWGSG